MKKTWTLQLSIDAEKNMENLDKPIRSRIFKFFHNRVLQSTNPRQFGKPLSGDLLGLWSYRVGDYRVICDIQDHEFVILAVDVGHRREIYD